MGIANEATVRSLCERWENDQSRLLDIVRAVHERFHCVDGQALDTIASQLTLSRAEVEGVVSFYSFLSVERQGRIVIRVCRDVVDRMKGADEVAAAFETSLGVSFGEGISPEGISLQYASCIGMSDQAPAALINDVVVPRLSPSSARAIVELLRANPGTEDLRGLLVDSYGDGNNSHNLVRAAVDNSIRKPGAVIFADSREDVALRNALSSSPIEVIRLVKAARLRGRGGAGFPTGVKWEHTRAAEGDQKYVICNADEGEPGTFKDRVILTERAHLLCEGMTIAGYAIGATMGIIYLRAEYAYLLEYLEHVLETRRSDGRLGKNLGNDFTFDIRIQLGAGAYICGEETALIESMEGKRGQPRFKPPFPAVRGYLGKPTSVNNVETFCCVARILEKGSAWFSSLGSDGSAGTKLLSVSGDCRRPGIYEVPFGISLRDVLALCGAEDVAAVQVGGPSGQMIPPQQFGRLICYDDLATGGALIVFNGERDLLEIASQYLGFFVHESCGYCTPCRVGNTLLKERLDKIRSGRGQAEDIAYLRDLAKTIHTASRCGLGWTSPNPVLSTLKGFPEEYERRFPDEASKRGTRFDLAESLEKAEWTANRSSTESGA